MDCQAAAEASAQRISFGLGAQPSTSQSIPDHADRPEGDDAARREEVSERLIEERRWARSYTPPAADAWGFTSVNYDDEGTPYTSSSNDDEDDPGWEVESNVGDVAGESRHAHGR